MAYIDTSVMAAYYCPEPLSAAAQREISNVIRPAISRLVEVLGKISREFFVEP